MAWYVQSATVLPKFAIAMEHLDAEKPPAVLHADGTDSLVYNYLSTVLKVHTDES